MRDGAEGDGGREGGAMTDIAKSAEVLPPVDLTALAKQINDNHSAIVSAAKSAVTKAIAAGEALIAAKAAVPDGTWLRWLKANCIVSERTAQLYMQLAEHKLQIEAATRDQPATIADQTLNGAIKMLRATSGNRKPGANLDVNRLASDVLEKVLRLPNPTAAAHRLMERLQEARLI
jgi:hypothetical protein